MPLPPADPDAFRQAEANLRRDGRAQAGLTRLGPGALDLAELMDRTASFLLAQVPDKLKALGPQGGYVLLTSGATRGSAGRLAAPLRGLQPPGAPTLFTYIITSEAFNHQLACGDCGVRTTGIDPPKCPCTVTSTDPFSTDQVTIGNNKGTITTTMVATQTVNGSRVTIDLTLKVNGEVRDAATGAILYKIANEYSGHADGDACPDASGIARATMTFSGRETYFDSSGAKSGSGVTESFGGELRVKADDNAKLAGVDLSTTGRGADLLMRMAAQNAAPAFEKGWRSGMCIALLVSPDGGDVERDSDTTVTVKVKHKRDGNELDKPVEALGVAGSKSIAPAHSKQKAPATFRFTSGETDGDKGTLSFESVSNRGIGKANPTFTVNGSAWTINIAGTTTQTDGGLSFTLQVSVKDLRVIQRPYWRPPVWDEAGLYGEGLITLTGPITWSDGCSGEVNETRPFTVEGTRIGTGSDSILRLSIHDLSVSARFTCPYFTPSGGYGYEMSRGFGRAFGIGKLELPADGGMKTVSGSISLGGLVAATSTGTFTVVRERK
jgi:hypothetical protein